MGRYRRRRRLRFVKTLVTLLVLGGLVWAGLVYGPGLLDRRSAAAMPVPSLTTTPAATTPAATTTATPPPPTKSPAPAKAARSASAAAGSADAATEAMELEVIALTNAKRREAGCTVHLQANPKLTRAARSHSWDMVNTGYFNHQSPDGNGPGERLRAAGYDTSGGWAENIALGYPNARAVVQAWMESPGHRANIVNCKMRSIGVGVARAGNGQLYWTQVFGGR